MSTQQLLVRLPEDLIQRLRRSVPAGGRRAFVQNLLEQALPAEIENTALLEAALAVEQDQELADEMAEWDCTIDDGFAYFKRVERERSSAARFGGSILIRRAALKLPSTVQQSS